MKNTLKILLILALFLITPIYLRCSVKLTNISAAPKSKKTAPKTTPSPLPKPAGMAHFIVPPGITLTFSQF